MEQFTKSNPRRFRWDWASIFLLLLGGVFLVESVKIFLSTTKIEPLGPGGWPLIMSAIWVLSILGVMVFQHFKQQPVPDYKINIRDSGTIRWICLVLFSLVYIFIVRMVGFLMTTLVYEFALMVCFGSTGKRNLVIAAIVSVVATLVVYFCYTFAFSIPLPGQL